MYPFERFSERAKKVLTLAQEEAERGHHSYIGTEHLLIGLLRETEGLAGKVLRELGVDVGRVRKTIESVIGRNERTIIQQIIPTSRVKKVIELSFDEARRMGHEYVGTEHILLGLLIEGEGIAARVLSDLGVTLDTARAEIERQLAANPTVESVAAPVSRPAESTFPDLETLGALLANRQTASLLRANGLDVEALANRLQAPPEVVSNLRIHLARLRDQLDRAVTDADYERAARIQKAHRALAARLRQAELEWLNELIG